MQLGIFNLMIMVLLVWQPIIWITKMEILRFVIPWLEMCACHCDFLCVFSLVCYKINSNVTSFEPFRKEFKL